MKQALLKVADHDFNKDCKEESDFGKFLYKKEGKKKLNTVKSSY